MALFIVEGKSELPVAIIQDGTTRREKIGIGTVSSIEAKVKEQQLSNPAIIVIGEVVRHREQILQIKEQYSKAEVMCYL